MRPVPGHTRRMRPTIGFIGIGNMGLAMASRLLDLGRAVRVREVDERRVARAIAQGASAAATPAALAAHCRLVVVAVVDAVQTEAVLFGADGLAQAVPSGACVMLCPTLGPASVEAFAGRLAALGADCIDAPMSGGPARARDGSMSLMVACAEAVFERHRGVIEALSSCVFRVSERPGDGARTKLVNNLLAAVNLAGAAEALALAERIGLDPARTQDVIDRSSGQSWIGTDRMRRALEGDLAPRAHTTLLKKDSNLALRMAEAVGFDAALGRRAAAVFEAACAAGFGTFDDASLLPFLSGVGAAATFPSGARAAATEAASVVAPPRMLGHAGERDMRDDERPDPALASAWAECALASLERPYPYALQHLMRDADDRPLPSQLHPLFHGSFDWHSSVHMHWSLVRLLRLCPDLPQRSRIVARFAGRFDAAAVAREMAHLQAHPGFERPYGWAWLMQLQGELAAASAVEPAAAGWSAALEPAIELLRSRWIDFLALSRFPQRAGIHTNSAFAMTLMHAQARARGDAKFVGALTGAALRWFGDDVEYPARYEPNANDFLSGGLCEAVLMAQVLDPTDFSRWWSRFAPATADITARWLRPVVPSSRTDAQLVHADGLNLSRAWCLGVLAGELPEQRERFEAARRAHLDASLTQATGGDYVASHWLVSFALLALTGVRLP